MVVVLARVVLLDVEPHLTPERLAITCEPMTRWIVLGSLPLWSMLLGAVAAKGAEELPILFVHGNGDSAALWQTIIWRFESNGYDPSLLFAIDMPHPAAPAEDSSPEPNRSTTRDQLESLIAEVESILETTGREKLVLIGSSRGGNVIRNYVRNAGGDRRVALAILCGTPNHGVSAKGVDLDNEFNGMGHFLSSLNRGTEVPPGVPFVTIRSDRNDKYAQPTGEFLGYPGEPTGVSYDGPELRSATNVVLPGLDHREVAFHPRAFREQFLAITGREPERVEILPETRSWLDGIVSGYENEAPTNLPLAGARVVVYETDTENGLRKTAPLRDVVVDERGHWGPFEASPTASYEFVVSSEGYPTIHYYRSPFPRSSRYVNLRLAPLEAFVGKRPSPAPGYVVVMSRPRGYFGHGRDRFTIGGETPDGVNEGVPGTSMAVRFFDADSQPVPVVFNDETIVVRVHPLSENRITVAEFHY
jgi:pimeloyl-ACP methyl ester carboxylesterase